MGGYESDALSATMWKSDILSYEVWGGVEVLTIVLGTLFQTTIYDFPYPISDATLKKCVTQKGNLGNSK